MLGEELHMCRFLEEELARKYKEAAPSTLAMLQHKCDEATVSLAGAEAQLAAMQDVASLRQAGASGWLLRIWTSWSQYHCLLSAQVLV